jgi:hypothetical protein
VLDALDTTLVGTSEMVVFDADALDDAEVPPELLAVTVNV